MTSKTFATVTAAKISARRHFGKEAMIDHAFHIVTAEGGYAWKEGPAPETIRKEAGAKASATKGEHGHKAAGLKAKRTRLERLRSALSGPDKGMVTRQINAVNAQLDELGVAA